MATKKMGLVVGLGLGMFLNLTTVRAGFIYPDFSNTAGLQIQQMAKQNGNVITLDDPSLSDYWWSGGVWKLGWEDITNGLTSNFTFRITNLRTDGGDGGDGVVFTMANVPPYYGRLQGTGATDTGDQTYVHFDTRSGNYVKIFHNSDQLLSVDVSSLGIDLNDGNIHSTSVIYNASGSNFKVYLDSHLVVDVPVISGNIPDTSGTGGKLALGFGTTSWGYNQEHDILSWSVTNSAVPEPATLIFLGFGIAGIIANRREKK